MEKNFFLEDERTQNFTDWLSQIIIGLIPLNFQNENKLFNSFNEIKNNYSWPPKETKLFLKSEIALIKKNSSLSDNQNLLDRLSEGMRASLLSNSDGDLLIWVKAILVWGGVYTFTKNRKGNAGWLEQYFLHGGLSDYLTVTFSKLNSLKNDGEIIEINNLRSNAGLTKIYALGCNNFVIYDSRVAASLTWLLSSWAKDSRSVPEHLRFATMRANTSKKEGKQRTANQEIFPYFTASGDRRNHNKHLLWNIRANWLLEQALSKANSFTGNVCSMRTLEASLFVMGENLRFAKQF